MSNYVQMWGRVNLGGNPPHYVNEWLTVAMFTERVSYNSVLEFVKDFKSEHPSLPIRVREISAKDGEDRVVFSINCNEV